MAEENLLQENLLIVEPQDDLRYTGPVAVIEMTNPTMQTCYFRINNTAPEGYIWISPSNGILQAKESSEFAVRINQIPCTFDIIIQAVLTTKENTDINDLFAAFYTDDSIGLKLKYSFTLSSINSVVGEITTEKDGELIIIQQYNGKLKTTTEKQPGPAEPSAVSSGTSLMELTNTTNQEITFKIKPQASSKYISQPMHVVLKPKKKTEIPMNLQPRKFNPLGFNVFKNNLGTVSFQFYKQEEDRELSLCIEPDPQNLGENNIYKLMIKSVTENSKSTAPNSVECNTKSSNGKTTLTIPSKESSKELDECKEQMSIMLQELAKLIQENIKLKADLEKLTAEQKHGDRENDASLEVEEVVKNPDNISEAVYDDSILTKKMGKK